MKYVTEVPCEHVKMKGWYTSMRNIARCDTVWLETKKIYDMTDSELGILTLFTGAAFYTIFLLYTRKNVESDEEQVENKIETGG